ncbi:hypothetical protein [Maribacter sp. 2-571]|uniref:hypothetical protein n=1 Tax=Maribacter sp. 2-571 TaxID=3417569 RepID=UPI003D34D87F
MKKNLVLITLFVLPIVAYLFFLSGTTNFGKLPALTENVIDIATLDKETTFKGKITVLGFLGNDVLSKQANVFNLNQKIYKRFYEFTDFQFVMVVGEGTEDKVEEMKASIGTFTDTQKWHFLYADGEATKRLFEGLKTDLTLEKDGATPYVFIIDKDGNLRGRDDDEDEGTKYGFDTASVAELNNKMEDDVKIILAEYRLALKKNNADRSK